MRLIKSLLSSGAATVTVLAILSIDPARMSVPALVAAGIVNFTANRRFAFGVRGPGVVRHAFLFACVQLVTIAFNAIAFDIAMRHVPAHLYWLVRLACSNAIWLCWSYPTFRRVFAVRAATVDRAPARPRSAATAT